MRRVRRQRWEEDWPRSVSTKASVIIQQYRGVIWRKQGKGGVLRSQNHSAKGSFYCSYIVHTLACPKDLFSVYFVAT